MMLAVDYERWHNACHSMQWPPGRALLSCSKNRKRVLNQFVGQGVGWWTTLQDKSAIVVSWVGTYACPGRSTHCTALRDHKHSLLSMPPLTTRPSCASTVRVPHDTVRLHMHVVDWVDCGNKHGQYSDGNARAA